MKEFFDIFDDKEAGKISNKDIEKVMASMGEYPTEERILEMINEIDYDADGLVDFDEFTCLMVKQIKDVENAEEELVVVFKRFDKDGDGQIDSIDLMHMMVELGNDMTEDDAKDIIHMFDRDGNMTINFQEFV